MLRKCLSVLPFLLLGCNVKSNNYTITKDLELTDYMIISDSNATSAELASTSCPNSCASEGAYWNGYWSPQNPFKEAGGVCECLWNDDPQPGVLAQPFVLEKDALELTYGTFESLAEASEQSRALSASSLMLLDESSKSAGNSGGGQSSASAGDGKASATASSGAGQTASAKAGDGARGGSEAASSKGAAGRVHGSINSQANSVVSKSALGKEAAQVVAGIKAAVAAAVSNNAALAGVNSAATNSVLGQAAASAGPNSQGFSGSNDSNTNLGSGISSQAQFKDNQLASWNGDKEIAYENNRKDETKKRKKVNPGEKSADAITRSYSTPEEINGMKGAPEQKSGVGDQGRKLDSEL